MSAMTLCISKDFLTAYSNLPRQVQTKVAEFMNKFRVNPKSAAINLEKLHDCLDSKFCSARIDNAYRAILVMQGDVYLLLWVDHHDEAYAWARKKRCAVNHENGSIQVFDVQNSEVEEKSSKNEADPKSYIKKLFADVLDKDLLALGVPKEQLSLVRSFSLKEDFYGAKAAFSDDVYENLSWIVEGVPVSEVLELLEEERIDNKQYTDDFVTALESPETLKSFVVIEGEDELKRILAEPLEKWRIFLHPTQRKIVNKQFSGPARVLGGAGTGKTVVAMHRAKFLASICQSSDRVLFTTFTKNLANDIKSNLKKICTPEEFAKIDVYNLDAWLSNFIKEQDIEMQIVYRDDDLNEIWSNVVDEVREEESSLMSFETKFFRDEWERVVVAQEAFSKEKYWVASRNGRGIRLDRKKRSAIWKVFEAYINRMREDKLWDVYYAMFECKELIARLYRSKLQNEALYKHIIVDEGQDFSFNAFRLIRLMAGEPHPNDLFIVGDAHQRIYRNKVVLSKANIDVRGRGNKLHINYRTTEETRRYAFALLNGLDFDDLDDSCDIGDKCQSLMHGEIPIVRNFERQNDEIDFIVSEIKKLQEREVLLNDICITARTRDIRDDYVEFLKSKGIKCFKLERESLDDRSKEGVRVSTMHRVKGLEFQYIFVVSANEDKIPLKAVLDEGIDPVLEKEALTSEKCLLYVALTRAQKVAYITSYGTKSRFL